MSITADDLLSLIYDATESPNAEVQSNADNQISELMKSNSPFFMELIYQIISNHNNPPKSIISTSVIFGRFLDYKERAHLDALKQIFENSECTNLINKTFEVVNDMVTCYGDTQIQIHGARLFSLFYQIKPEIICEKLKSYLDQCLTEDSPIDLKFVCIEIFDDIYNICFEPIIVPLILEMTNVLKQNLLLPDSDDTIELKKKSLNLLSNISAGYKDQSFVNEEYIIDILNILRNIIEIPNIDLNSFCHSFLLSVATNFYHSIELFMEFISQFTLRGLTIESEDSEEYQKISLKFWHDFSNFEYKIRKDQSQELKNICSEGCSLLFDPIMNCIFKISTDTLDIEDPSEITLSSAAMTTLGSLCKSSPTDYLPLIANAMSNLQITSDNWIDKYVFAVLFYIIACKITEIEDKRFLKEVDGFVNSNFFTIFQLLQTDNQRLREIVLWVVGQTIARHPSLFVSLTSPLDLYLQMMEFINYKQCITDEAVDPLIHLRIISIIYNICRCYSPNSVYNLLSISMGGNMIESTVMTVLKLPRTQDNEDLLERCYECLNVFYRNCPSNEVVFDDYLSKTLKEMEFVINTEFSESVKFVHMASLTSNLSTLMTRIRVYKNLLRNYLYPVWDLMFTLLTNTNCMIYVEAMNCLTTVIACSIGLQETDQTNEFLQELVSDKSKIDQLNDFVTESFNSQDNIVIFAASNLIIQMYKYIPEMLQYSPIYLELFINIIQSDSLNISCKAIVFDALMTIIKYLPIDDCLNLQEVVVEFNGVFINHLTQQLQEDDDEKSVLLMAISRCFEVLALKYPKDEDPKSELSTLNLVISICTKIDEIRNPSDECLERALDMVGAFGAWCSKLRKPKLRHRKIKEMMEIAKQRTYLKEKVNDVMNKTE
ncbi:hypothetical protein TVAG_156550 [Trichomonas vaginalis G3]|uniref:Importin N-terminal domain-containing protein n=1 Tax=Trichomonas vaginalis (strain ATCC PRA-98 / G3) TaxID=412133 RepID=A2FRS7_TRIV3|nr:armadillo (ARM) repeat-containing protein family [Trichomonas vaginalis G3]EAX92376.1 hypothetical protein TVAG_156550 [Trichomonas vaginalis G3]KAI5544551.1 armadillo (ARM) repeat-containing protein family [Trichomonas vaginalis G3]|eukprot:XP_001305306.1 hypothetical protein [Trichomonas vaginalis G3]